MSWFRKDKTMEKMREAREGDGSFVLQTPFITFRPKDYHMASSFADTEVLPEIDDKLEKLANGTDEGTDDVLFSLLIDRSRNAEADLTAQRPAHEDTIEMLCDRRRSDLPVFVSKADSIRSRLARNQAELDRIEAMLDNREFVREEYMPHE